MRLLQSYDWPGNVRELRNVIDRFATFQKADPSSLFDMHGSHLGDASGLDVESLALLPYAEAKRRLLDAYHRSVIPRIIEQHGGSVPKAAASLGMSRTNLYRVLQDTGSQVGDDD
jgi:DNA-binding NtrC family response regulator